MIQALCKKNVVQQNRLVLNRNFNYYDFEI